MIMIQLMCNVNLEDRIRSDELRVRLNLDSIATCVQSRRHCWFGHMERLDENVWVSKGRAFEVASSVGKVKLKKHGMK